MKRIFLLYLTITLLLLSCSKDDGPVYSGTVTINNVVSTPDFSATGLYIPGGRLTKNTASQEDVLVLQVDFDINYEVRKIFLSVNNFSDSFARYAVYPDDESAAAAFNNLKSFGTVEWKEVADTIIPGQIWLYRTSDDRFAKFRIVSTFTEKRDNMTYPFGEAVIEWVFQPDGTQSFR